MLTAANFVTLLRLILAPLVAADIVHGHYGRAIILTFADGFMYVIDEYLASLFKDSTMVGAYFESIADKIMLSLIYVALGIAGAMPWWMVAIFFGRDILILGMSLYGLLFTSVRQFPPSVWGKLSTFFQIAAALIVMGDRDGIPVPLTLALSLMVAATVWSGVEYVCGGITLLRANQA